MSSTTTREIHERVENISPEKKRKKKIWNIVFIIFNVLVLALVFILNRPEAEDYSFAAVMRQSHPLYLIAAVGVFALAVLAEILIFYYLIRLTTGRRRFLLAAKTSFVGRYYDNVTPIASGGQPFQIYTLNKAGVPGAIATNLPLVRYFTYMILYCIMGLYVLVFRVSVLDTLGSAQRVIMVSATWIGLLLNLALPVFIFMCSVIKPLGNFILKWSLRIGKALRLVKDYGAAYLKAQKMLTEYQKSLRITAKPVNILIMTVLNLITYTATAVMPYFVVLAFTGEPFVIENMFNTACMTVICLIACSFFPAPGASGAAELSFGVVFSMALTGSFLSVALLTWRIISFYSFIAIGISILIHGQIKARKTAIKEAEALKFDAEQIKEAEAEAASDDLTDVINREKAEIERAFKEKTDSVK